jgi:hypothetical protein
MARPFLDRVLLRPTRFRMSPRVEKPEMHEVYEALARDVVRNDQIFEDLLAASGPDDPRFCSPNGPRQHDPMPAKRLLPMNMGSHSNHVSA